MPSTHGTPWTHLAVAAIVLLCSVGVADTYETNKILVDETQIRGLQRTAAELLNRTDGPLDYAYSFDKERCYRWNVGVTVLRKFNLGTSQSSCRKTGSYSTSGWLDPGQRVRVYAQAWTDYWTYLAQRIRIDDVTKEETIVDSVYATQERQYEQYWRVVR